MRCLLALLLGCSAAFLGCLKDPASLPAVELSLGREGAAASGDVAGE